MTILIPAYEPTEKMLTLILELQAKTNYKILIIDDGSGESYQNLFAQAETYGCMVLHHNKNLGKGAALKTGYKYLLSEDNSDKVICVDSDGQHHVDDIIKIANSFDENKTEMVLGVRQFSGKVPLKSRFGNMVSAFFFRMATGITINDTQTGLRAYPYELLPWLCSVDGNRFEYELNLLLSAKKSGIGIKQIPITTIYDDNNKGTHFRPIRDSIRVFLPLIKFCGSSLTSAILDFILLFLFQALTGSLFLGVVIARIISSVFNYSVNKALVFKSDNLSNRQSAPKYFSLVIIIMLANYCLLALMTKFVGIPDVPAKLLTEITLFFASYTMQRLFVFQRHNTKRRSFKQFGTKNNKDLSIQRL